MKTTSVSLLVIRTRDMKMALAFYSALGLNFSEERHGSGPLHYACELMISFSRFTQRVQMMAPIQR